MGEYHNRKYLKNYRKRLRNNLTSAEAVLWTMLSNKKLGGRKFRRQHSIGNYIVDFYCSSEKLIVELDGDCHGDYIKIQEDIRRDQELINKGYIVLRIENRFVFQDPEYVLREIERNFNK